MPERKPRALKVVREGEHGTEKRCPRCTEWWPADTTFFHSNPSNRSGLADWCIACYAEWRNRRRLGEAQPAPVVTSVFTQVP